MTPSILFALSVMMIVTIAEVLHARRMIAGRLLLFPALRHRVSGRTLGLCLIATSLCRIASLSLLAGSACTLWTLSPAAANASSSTQDDNLETARRLLIVLDVSPSMTCKDVDNGRLSRAELSRDAIVDFLHRRDLSSTRTSVLILQDDAKPVVIDTSDPNVVAGIVSSRLLWSAFAPASTDLGKSLTSAFASVRTWPDRSASLLLVTDGDSEPLAQVPQLPSAFDRIVVAGVGDTDTGAIINGHRSRQNLIVLEQIAAQYGGKRVNLNVDSIPDALLPETARSPATKSPSAVQRQREHALWLSVLSAASLGLLLPIAQRLISHWMLSDRHSRQRRSTQEASCAAA